MIIAAAKELSAILNSQLADLTAQRVTLERDQSLLLLGLVDGVIELLGDTERR